MRRIPHCGKRAYNPEFQSCLYGTRRRALDAFTTVAFDSYRKFAPGATGSGPRYGIDDTMKINVCGCSWPRRGLGPRGPRVCQMVITAVLGTGCEQISLRHDAHTVPRRRALPFVEA